MRDPKEKVGAAGWRASCWTRRHTHTIARRFTQTVRSHAVLLGNSSAIAMGTLAAAVLDSLSGGLQHGFLPWQTWALPLP